MQDLKKARIRVLFMDKTTNSPVVLLEIEGTSKIIPIWIGSCEAWALAMALENMDFPRPLTHDLLLSCIENLDARLDKIVIHSVRNNTYYASIYLMKDGEGKLLEIDSRPSDAMILAVKTDTPIYVTSSLVEENGIDVEGELSLSMETEGGRENDEDKEFKKFVENLDIDQFREILKRRSDEKKEERDEE